MNVEVVVPRPDGYSAALDDAGPGPASGECSLLEAAQMIVECASMRSERDATMMSIASLEISSGPSGPSNTLAECQLTSTQNTESVAAGLAAAAAILGDNPGDETPPRASRRSSRSPSVSRSNSNSPFFIRMNEGDDPPSPVYRPAGEDAASDDPSIIAISPPVGANQGIPLPPAVFQLPPYGPGPSQVNCTWRFRHYSILCYSQANGSPANSGPPTAPNVSTPSVSTPGAVQGSPVTLSDTSVASIAYLDRDTHDANNAGPGEE